MNPSQPSFNFLHLPNRPLQIVLKSLTPLDIVAVSLLSPHYTQTVRILRPKIEHIDVKIHWSHVEIRVENRSFYCRCPEGSTVPEALEKACDVPREQLIYDFKYSGRFEKDWRDDGPVEMLETTPSLEAFKKTVEVLVEHLCFIFDKPIRRLSVEHLSLSVEDLEKSWNFVKNHETVRLCDGPLTNLDIDDYFSSPAATKKKTLDLVFYDGYSNLFYHFDKFKHYDTLWAEGRGFRNAHLMRMNMRKFIVTHTKITGFGVNGWLKKWLAGRERRTEEVEVLSCKRFNVGNVLEGVEYVNTPHPESRYYKLRTVTRADGAKANVTISIGQVRVDIDYSGCQ